MSRTVTLRLEDEVYNIFKNHAKNDNRPMSNFIETATLRYINEIDYVDYYEMQEILNNKELLSSLKEGHEDAEHGRGKFVG